MFFLVLPKSSYGWYVHVQGTPDRACPGTVYDYWINASPNDGLLLVSCYNCLIEEPEGSGSWTTQVMRSRMYGDQIDGFGFNVKFSESANSAVISAQLTFMSGLITVHGSKTITLGPPTVTSATITGNNFLANCNSATNGYALTNISTGWSLDDWTVQLPLTTVNETSNSTSVTTSNTTSSGLSTLTARMIYTEQGNTCGTQNINFNIWYGKPSNSYIRVVDYSTGNPPSYLCSMNYNYLKADHTLGINPVSDWEWQCSYNWYLYYPDYPDKSIAF